MFIFKNHPFMMADGAGAGSGGSGEGSGTGASTGERAGGSAEGSGNSKEGSGEGTKTPEELRAELAAEFEKKLQSEADKRVTEAIKKTTEKLKNEFAEKERKAKLTEEQLKKEEDERKAKEQAQKDYELNLRALKLDLVDKLAENQMDLRFRDLIGVDELVQVEPEKRVEALDVRVKAFKTIFDEIISKRLEEEKKEFLKGQTPGGAGKKDSTPPNAYEKAKQSGDVKGMIASKFGSRQ